MLIIHDIWRLSGDVLVVIMGGLALWRGGWAERSAAVLILAGWFLTPLLQRPTHPGPWVMLLDVTVTVIMFVISERSRRLWTLVMTACLLAGDLSHLADLVVPPSHKMYFAYVTVLGFTSGYLVALCLGLAVAENAWLRRWRRDGKFQNPKP